MTKFMKNNRGLAPVLSKQGMALVVALLTSFILLALVASLFWVIASTSRQVEYAKNSAIALNLAEAGTADAIYRLNYETELNIGNYPFNGTDNPFGTSQFVALPNNFLTDALFPGLIPGGISDEIGIMGTFAENGGVYYVGIQGNTYPDPDMLVAVGIYKGVRRILTVPLRGNSLITPPTLRQGPTQGISEAFNKHVVYSNIAQIILPATGTIVTGNIVYVTDPISPNILPITGTKTKTDPALFGIPTPVDINLDIANDPGEGFSIERYLLGIDQADGITTFDSCYGAGAYAGGVYTFNVDTVVNSVETDGNIVFSGTNTVSNFVRANNGTITMGGTMTINTNAAFFASGGITVNGLTTQAAGTGVLAVRNSNLTLSGATSNIDSSGSAKKAAIICYSTSGTVTVTVNANLTSTLSPGQAVIIAYADSANDATINIGANVNGLIYAYSSGPTNFGNITLNTGIITGALVADGTVTLNGGTLNYGTSGFTGAGSGGDIFSGFSGGRRAYVPTWQGWRLR